MEIPTRKRKFVKKDIGYYRTIVIVIIAFSIIGNYLYENDSHLYTDHYFYAGSDPEHPIVRYLYDYRPITLEGGHEYTIFVYMGGEPYLTLALDFTFETLNNFTHTQTTGAEKTFLGIWGTNTQYLSSFPVEEDEVVVISGVVTSNLAISSFATWYIRIYQDLPPILIKKVLLIAVFDMLVLAIWFIAYEQYEKVFEEIKQKKLETAQNQNDQELLGIIDKE